MTYNVNYLFMNPTLAKKDYQKKVAGQRHDYLNTVAKVIQDNGAYDFVALQEASNLNGLKQQCKILKSMLCREHSSNDFNMATFVDKSYRVDKDVVKGNLSKNRPYMILTGKTPSRKTFAFVNIHNGRRFKKGTQTEYPRHSLDAIATIVNSVGAVDVLIVAGDFNDEGQKFYENLGKPRTPLLRISTPGTTCCYADTSKELPDQRIGDYVLSNLKTQNEVIHAGESDHWPVIATIELPAAPAVPGGGRASLLRAQLALLFVTALLSLQYR